MPSPVVSIVIPAFNPGPFMELALTSVLDQTFADWEVIVVDDGSTEDLSALGARDARIKLIRQANAGQSIARNVGTVHARGEFIAYLDQDDIWLPTKLERQVEAMQAGVTLCHTQFTFIDSSGQDAGDGFGRMQTYYEMLEGAGVCGASTVMVRRSDILSVGMFDVFNQPAEDYDVYLKLLYRGKMAFVATVEAKYRLHESNQTRQYRRAYASLHEILRKHQQYAAGVQNAAAVRSAKMGMKRIQKTAASQAFEQARVSWRHGKITACASHLMWCFRQNPAHTLLLLRGKLQRFSPGKN